MRTPLTWKVCISDPVMHCSIPEVWKCNNNAARISTLEYLVVVLSVESRQTDNSLSSVGTGCKVSGTPSLGTCYPSHGVRTGLAISTCWVRTTTLQLFGQSRCSGQTLLLHPLTNYGFHRLRCLQNITRLRTQNQYLKPIWFYFTLTIQYTKWTHNGGVKPACLSV
jgi:hypothetical protein